MVVCALGCQRNPAHPAPCLREIPERECLGDRIAMFQLTPPSGAQRFQRGLAIRTVKPSASRTLSTPPVRSGLLDFVRILSHMLLLLIQKLSDRLGQPLMGDPVQ